MTTKLTITEALADIKTTSARIKKKKEVVMRYFARDSKLRDPLENEGGSKEFVRRERQGIKDLEEKVVLLRSAIQQLNLNTELTIGDEKKTVTQWLNWRREIANDQKAFLSQMANQLSALRQQATRQGLAVTDKDSNNPGDVLVMVNEKELAGEIEKLEEILGSLDGKLSLLNATTFIEF